MTLDDHQLRPLLPPVRKTSSVVAEYVGTILIPIFFVGMVISLRYTFAGGDWECSGDGCLEEFDRLRGWTFPVPLFAMVFICTFGFVAAILLRIWGRSGRPPTFEPKARHARPVLTGVGRTLTWVGILEIGLAGAFAWAEQWLTAGILGSVGLALVVGARRVAARAARSDRILETGTPAIAEITDVEQTGTTLNDNPMLKLTLTIYDDDQPLFPVVHKEFVPQAYMSRIQVGARLPVKIDPLDSSSLVIEWDKRLEES
ncbi:MAG: hypothetical protein ABR575_07120 [Actinomycetota bacterium]